MNIDQWKQCDHGDLHTGEDEEDRRDIESGELPGGPLTDHRGQVQYGHVGGELGCRDDGQEIVMYMENRLTLMRLVMNVLTRM